jgi:hypothetical protein
VRFQAATAIVKIGPSAVNVLINALPNEDANMRLNAMLTLGHIGPLAKRAAPMLVEAMKDKDFATRGACALALGRMGPEVKEEAAAGLKDLLQDPRDSIRISAALALVQIHPQDKGFVDLLTREIQKTAKVTVLPLAAKASATHPLKEAQYESFLNYFIFRNSFRFGDGLDSASHGAMNRLGYDAIPAMVRAYNKLAMVGGEGKVHRFLGPAPPGLDPNALKAFNPLRQDGPFNIVKKNFQGQDVELLKKTTFFV